MTCCCISRLVELTYTRQQCCHSLQEASYQCLVRALNSLYSAAATRYTAPPKYTVLYATHMTFYLRGEKKHVWLRPFSPLRIYNSTTKSTERIQGVTPVWAPQLKPDVTLSIDRSTPLDFGGKEWIGKPKGPALFENNKMMGELQTEDDHRFVQLHNIAICAQLCVGLTGCSNCRPIPAFSSRTGRFCPPSLFSPLTAVFLIEM